MLEEQGSSPGGRHEAETGLGGGARLTAPRPEQSAKGKKYNQKQQRIGDNEQIHVAAKENNGLLSQRTSVRVAG